MWSSLGSPDSAIHICRSHTIIFAVSKHKDASTTEICPASSSARTSFPGRPQDSFLCLLQGPILVTPSQEHPSFFPTYTAIAAWHPLFFLFHNTYHLLTHVWGIVCVPCRAQIYLQNTEIFVGIRRTTHRWCSPGWEHMSWLLESGWDGVTALANSRWEGLDATQAESFTTGAHRAMFPLAFDVASLTFQGRGCSRGLSYWVINLNKIPMAFKWHLIWSRNKRF